MDLLFINDSEKQKFGVGLSMMITIFAKNMVVVPIQSKEEGNVAAGMIEEQKK